MPVYSTLASIASISSSDSPKWCPISCTRTWVTISPKRVLVLGPIVEDRPAIQPDHVGHELRGRVRLERQSDALEQTKQIELALGTHALENLVSRKILNSDDEVLTEITEVLRKTRIRLRRKALDIRHRRRRRSAPIVELACHGNVVGEVCMRSKRLTASPRMRNGWRP